MGTAIYPMGGLGRPSTIALYYASDEFGGNTIDIDFSVVNQWEDLTGMLVRFTPFRIDLMHLTGRVRIRRSGLYRVSGRIEFESTVNNVDYTGALFVNGSPDFSTKSTVNVQTAAVNEGMIAVGMTLPLQRNDELKIMLKSNNVPGTIKIDVMNIEITGLDC